MPYRSIYTVFTCAYLSCKSKFAVAPKQLKTAKYCSRRCHGLATMEKRYPTTLAERFFQKVVVGTPRECWIWQASKGSTGYGFMRVPEQNRNVGAHVISWFLEHHIWPAPGMYVCHTCDNPPCVNPAHLWLGTPSDNGKDMVTKGRHSALTHPEKVLRGDQHPHRIHPERAARGAHNPNTKITDVQWQEALSLWATGHWSKTQLAVRYGVRVQSISSRFRRDHISLLRPKTCS